MLTGGLDRSVASPIWSADNRAVYVQVEDKGTNEVKRVGLDGSIREIATGLTGSGLDRPYAGGEYSVARNGAVAVTVGDALHPSDIGVVSGGGVRRLASLNTSLLAAKALGQPQKLPSYLKFRPAADRRRMSPPDFDPAKKYPLILESTAVRSRPTGRASTDDQLYASAGYVVLYTNPRGSTSYGEELANQIDKSTEPR